MCEYCKNYFTGNDWKAIKSQFVRAGVFGDLEAFAAIEDFRGEPCLTVGVDVLAIPGDNVFQSHKKIKYCPMCGKNLIEGGRDRDGLQSGT